MATNEHSKQNKTANRDTLNPTIDTYDKAPAIYKSRWNEHSSNLRQKHNKTRDPIVPVKLFFFKPTLHLDTNSVLMLNFRNCLQSL